MDNKRKIISIVLKIITAVCSIVGVIMSTKTSPDGFMRGPRAFLYFTIQSNCWIGAVAIIGLILLMAGKVPSRKWFVTKLVFTVSITLTGFVFCFVLAPTMGAGAFVTVNVLTHVIVPISAIIDYLIVGGYTEYRKADQFYVIIPPLYYTVFASVGYILKWNFGGGLNYPYFFLNWSSECGAFGFSSSIPFMGVFWWIIVLLMFLIAVASLYLIIVNKTKSIKKAD